MTILKHTRKTNEVAGRQSDRIEWGKLAVTLLGVIGLSFGLAYLFQNLATKLHFPLYELAWLAYLTVFLTSLAANLTIIAPVPIGLSIMTIAAAEWNPAIVAFSASIGACIGELSGYFAGRLERKVAVFERAMWRNRFEQWIQQWGPWAIFFLAFQPILPFDVAGLVAGAAKMPLRKFLPALWAGRFPKYLIVAYAGAGIIHHLPLFSPR